MLIPFGRLTEIEDLDVSVFGHLEYKEGSKSETVNTLAIRVINEQRSRLLYYTSVDFNTFVEYVTVRNMNTREVLLACLENVVKVKFKNKKLFSREQDLTKDKDFFINELRKLIQKS